MMDPIIQGIAWYVAFLFSVTLHEAAHAWAAKLGGDLTAYHEGQVTLDPIPHMRREPFGTIMLPILSLFIIRWPFGYASAPYDPTWGANHPRRASLMALAGPLANLALAVVAALLIRAGVSYGFFRIPATIGYASVTMSPEGGVSAGLAMLLSMLFSLNMILAILNLFPLPPLDGSGVLALFMPEDTARKFQEFTRNPAFGFIGLLLAWQLFNPIFSPVFLAAVNLLYPEVKFQHR